MEPVPGNDSLRGLWAKLRPFAWVALAMLVVSMASRLGLSLWQFEHVSAVQGWGWLAANGLRVDIATLCLLLGLPLIAFVLLPVSSLLRNAMRVWLVACMVVLAFLEAATPAFMAEYGLRPNRLFLEYLIYPKEVLSTLEHGHLLSSIAGLVIAAVVAWAGWRWTKSLLPARATPRVGFGARVLAAVALLFLAALGQRSTLGHRPLNPAMVAFSSDPTVNQLPLNSTYALLYAAYEWISEEDGAGMYGRLPWPEVVAEVRRQTGLPPQAFAYDDVPTLAAHTPVYRGKPRNLVIILEESLGAQFVGHLGGLPLTPQIDALSEQGWRFERLYATGTRSVRGIEAVVTGFTPTPAQAVVKLPRSQHGFFTIAEVLARHGYDTAFYYGGESHFDNMRGFFLGNGFKRIVDQPMYPRPVFTGSWGVSDEDLMRRAHEEFNRQHATGKPFFGLVFSSSNHDPFEYPDGRITPYETPRQTRNNAAKYADYAVGEFFRLAQKSPYWKDTVFLIVADHDSRVFGKELVPIHNFHIPGVLLGAGIAPRHDARVISQIDLPPTLLSLLGIGDATPMIGRDLNDPKALVRGRAMMQYDHNFAWIQGDDVEILTPGGASNYRWNARNDTLSPKPQPQNAALQRTALAMALWGSETYRRGSYRLDPPDDRVRAERHAHARP